MLVIDKNKFYVNAKRRNLKAIILATMLEDFEVTSETESFNIYLNNNGFFPGDIIVLENLQMLEVLHLSDFLNNFCMYAVKLINENANENYIEKLDNRFIKRNLTVKYYYSHKTRKVPIVTLTEDAKLQEDGTYVVKFDKDCFYTIDVLATKNDIELYVKNRAFIDNTEKVIYILKLLNDTLKDELILKTGDVLKYRKSFNYNVRPYRTPGYDRLTSFGD